MTHTQFNFEKLHFTTAIKILTGDTVRNLRDRKCWKMMKNIPMPVHFFFNITYCRKLTVFNDNFIWDSL